MNMYSFRYDFRDQESSSIREVGSQHSPEAAALQSDIPHKTVDVATPDKNNSSQTMHSTPFDIRFNPDIFTPGVC